MTADIRVQFSFWTLVWSCGANLLQLTSPRCWGTLAGRSSTRDLASRSVVDRGRGWTSHCGMSVFILGYFLAIGIELNLAAAAFYGIRPLTSTWEFSFALWGKKREKELGNKVIPLFCMVSSSSASSSARKELVLFFLQSEPKRKTPNPPLCAKRREKCRQFIPTLNPFLAQRCSSGGRTSSISTMTPFSWILTSIHNHRPPSSSSSSSSSSSCR